MQFVFYSQLHQQKAINFIMENQTEDQVLGCTEIKILSSEVMCIYEDRKKYPVHKEQMWCSDLKVDNYCRTKKTLYLLGVH